jgi:hypothetical protein
VSQRAGCPVAATSAVCSLLLTLAVPGVGRAGTGRLLSAWMSRAPAIDGVIDDAEWADAKEVYLGDGIHVHIGNDARTLYLAVLDANDTMLNPGYDFVVLHFDDEGGEPPVLDDGVWTNGTCQGPDAGEGTLTFGADGAAWFYEFIAPGNTFCPPARSLAGRVSFAVLSRASGGLNYEMAIPLDGPSPLRGGPGQRFAFWLRVLRDGSYWGCLPDPSCDDVPRASWQNQVLASGGCNTGPQGFGTGLPHVGLPLDWTSELLSGSGAGWDQSSIYGDPVFCQSNETGGDGAAACVCNALAASPSRTARLRMPVNLVGQETATLRLRAALDVDQASEFLDISAKRQDGSVSNLLFWTVDGSGPAEWVLSLESPVVEIWLSHSTATGGGTEGGYAQVDDVDLRCGPILFADDFESGLSTHWSSTL